MALCSCTGNRTSLLQQSKASHDISTYNSKPRRDEMRIFEYCSLLAGHFYSESHWQMGALAARLTVTCWVFFKGVPLFTIQWEFILNANESFTFGSQLSNVKLVKRRCRLSCMHNGYFWKLSDRVCRVRASPFSILPIHLPNDASLAHKPRSADEKTADVTRWRQRQN